MNNFFNKKIAPKNKTVVNPFEVAQRNNSYSERNKPLFEKPQTSIEREKGNNNFSNLDLMALQEAYKKKDEDEIARLQGLLYPEKQEKEDQTKLHKQRIREEEEFLLRKKQEEEEKKREELQELERKKQEAQDIANSRPIETPMGKIRRTIFGGGKKKATTVLPVERKPDSGGK